MKLVKRHGALSYQELLQLMASGYIQNSHEERVQPASIDLSIGEEAYRAWGSVLPLPGVPVREFLRAATLFRHDLSQPLEPGGTYLIKAGEKIHFPTGLYGYTNAKSSAGRIDLHVRLVADGVPRYDTIPHGFNGEIWFLISSGHFLVKLAPGDTTSQLRIFDRDTRFDETEMQEVYPQYQFLWTPRGKPLGYDELSISDHDGSLILTLDLRSSPVTGYRAKRRGDSPVLTFGAHDHDPADFFEPIERPRKQRLMLDDGGFYIFATKEYVRVPPDLACEMVAVDERSGKFRSHYAGYFDPGWGYGREGNLRGWPATLEIRPFTRNVIAADGGPVCRMKYERVRETPEKVYGETGPHYTDQKGPRLSKHFKQK